MNVIIAGSRTILDQYPSGKVHEENYELLEQAVVKSKFTVSTVIEGEAGGVDRLGKLWAIRNNINCISMPAEWRKYGKSAGYRRNTEMAEIADAVIILWDGNSKGTKHMIDIANKANLPVYVQLVQVSLEREFE